jgi:hypothetical protein
MKTLFASVAAVVALAGVAAPAAAQSYDHRTERHDSFRRDDREIARRLEKIDQRIDRGVERRQLSRREAQSLRIELRDIARLSARARNGGLSYREVALIDRRLDRLEIAVKFERNDRQYGDRRW